ncbi:MAG: D-tyrosyl-tRNA(Tyr) deacylase [Bacilli bacterium]|nr:D-tyrosyl-tRNA(Tyr) deacylase [Bacilli bacterium]MBO4682262.1 D-tyrosyl-tRNA(Tyr) deacylase [Bacilli bacterium]
MRVVLTTVNRASVTIQGKVVSSISRGFLLLVGFTSGDNEEIVEKMVDKILSLRVFPDEHGQINISLDDVDGRILSVSQFTLYGDVKKGRRPSFVDALRPFEAEKLYDYFNLLIEQKRGMVATGVFGADMKVESENDGPFTLLLDSKELFPL